MIPTEICSNLQMTAVGFVKTEMSALLLFVAGQLDMLSVPYCPICKKNECTW